jgi:glycosyltransferase involved in cell wall biosynthesis
MLPRPLTPRAVTNPPGVLFLINDLRLGGAERVLLSYVNHVRHIRPVVALIQPNAELLDELNPGVRLAALGQSTVRWSEVPALQRGRGRLLLDSPSLLYKAYHLARLAREADCRVVSTFLNRSHLIALAAKALFEPSLRVVINVHETPTQHLNIFFSPPERALMRLVMRRSFPTADRIIAVSKGVRQDLIERFGLPPRRVEVVHNPIDLQRIRRASEDPTCTAAGEAGARVVAVGRLVRLKGFDVLIRAFAGLPERLNPELLVIGDGEERPVLERLVASLGLTHRVRLLGAQSNPWKYMVRADLIALSSRTEAFPLVIGEALALARPVIATTCSDGIREYLENGRCGILVPPDDVDSLTRGMERILTDPVLRRRLSERGRRRVQALDLPVAVNRYETLLREVCRMRN